ncbi:MAG: UvrD-helicase domain-containing protein [Erysipelotrichaceae bacterium]|nr:UvrD-helicase domain-containing protein [Erysipelotrichaceae bacterium]
MLTSLNPQQLQAVTTPSKYVRIIAGAGSGKTRVLTTRIAYLIDKIGADPRRIVAITFTNKAANEMKQRVENLLGEAGTGVHISTIHSLCVRILREDIMAMGYPRNFTVWDQDDQKAVLKEAYKEIGLDSKEVGYSMMLDYIAGYKSLSMKPEAAMIRSKGDIRQEKKAKIYEYYVNRQLSMYALDFDDLLLWTRDMFRDHEEILKKWQYRFQYILVDEFQDVDNIQYEIVQQLAGSHNEVYVVGDPDQTIYTWRGANVEIIMHFDRDFSPCETIVLNQNYRSTQYILDGANSLIANNRDRIKKDLVSVNDKGQKIYHYSAMSEEQEANWLATKIMELKRRSQNAGNGPVAYSQMAILYRANYISRSLEKGLRDYQIPYVIYGGVRFYDRMEIKDMLCYLRMLTSADDLAFKRVINQPKRGFGNKSMDTLLNYARKNGMSMYDAIEESDLSGKAKNTVLSFRNTVEGWKSRMKDLTLEKILEMVYEESGYRKMLEEEKDEERIKNVKELMNDMRDFMLTYEDSDLSEYLQMVNLYTDKEEQISSEHVKMMTVHAAKGLEFDVVFVCGMSEGVFPSERSVNESVKGLEEERRLAYVAYTRARKELYLTEPQGYSFVLDKPRTTSRFIKEIHKDCIEHSDRMNKFHDEKQQQFNRMMTSSVTPQQQKGKPALYRTGDHVEHTVYGKGIVVSVKGNLVDIAFSHPYGVKTMMAAHPTLKKV